jgi:L-threonylcarbamoyladenylate synthase
METILTSSPVEAARYIRTGELVAFPTETVYGLGADAFNEEAIAKIFVAKRRPADNPLIVHIGALDDLALLCSNVPPEANLLMDRFFPGPLTIVLTRKSTVPDIVTAGLETVGVRMPRDPVANSFLRAVGGPVAAPSANLSGRPSPTTWQAVSEDLEGRIACILKGESSEIGMESTVVDFSAGQAVILRPGAVTLEEIIHVIPSARMISAGDPAGARSPGTRHRHYSPRAVVTLVEAPPTNPAPNSAYIGLERNADLTAFAFSKTLPDTAEYARSLFQFFRESDWRGISTIYCERVQDTGLGRALMDRLERAADS